MESDLRPQRPELVLKDLITAGINEHRWVTDCLCLLPSLPRRALFLSCPHFLSTWHSAWQVGGR